MWQDQPLVLYWDARIYNIFAMSVLLYVAQLEVPPRWVLDGVEKPLSKVAKGPGGIAATGWASAEDLWTLKEAYGMHASFGNLEWMAKAP